MSWFTALLGIDEKEFSAFREAITELPSLRNDLAKQLKQYEELKREMNRRYDELATGAFGSVVREVLEKLNRDQLIEAAKEEAKTVLGDEIQKAAKDLVVDGDLSDTIWNNIDEDTLVDRVIEALAESGKLETWLKENTDQVVEAIINSIRDNDDLDWDELNDRISERIVDRLAWSKEEEEPEKEKEK